MLCYSHRWMVEGLRHFKLRVRDKQFLNLAVFDRNAFCPIMFNNISEISAILHACGRARLICAGALLMVRLQCLDMQVLSGSVQFDSLGDTS